MKQENFMAEAILEAKKACSSGDVPVGAIIVKDGEIIGRGYNMREKNASATAHAEVVAIEDACKNLGSPRIDGAVMYVTLEPCPMCAGAIAQARLDKVVFGAYDEKAGAVGSVFNLYYDFKFPHIPKFCGGVMEKECAALLDGFFENLRRNK